MALINCRNCGKEISDKAEKCPACGHEVKTVICVECGHLIEPDASSCSNCGCPAEISENTEKQAVVVAESSESKESKKSRTWIVIVAIVVVLVVGLFVVIGNGDKNSEPANNSATTETEATAATEPEYLLPNSSSEYITEEDLDGFSIEECTLAQYEIYARHGLIFPDAEYQEYFEAKSWYEPTIPGEEFSESVFNQYEISNLSVIGNYQYTLTLAGVMDIGEAEYIVPADYERFDGQKVKITGDFDMDRNGDMHLYGAEEFIYLDGVTQEEANSVFESGFSWVEVIGEFHVDEYGAARIDVQEFIVSEI